MAWQMYKIVLRLLTPLHVGAGQVGNVQRARRYIPGKTLWGALTARITRDTRPGAITSDYREIGDQIKAHLAFSYLYPSIEKDVDVWPWDDEADEFDWRYMDTYASTARNPGHNTALLGSLHEAEFIAPATRDGDPVSLIGYIFERDDCSLPWREALSCLQLGGERTYGWGRVRVKELLAKTLFFQGWDVTLNADRPVLRAVDGKARLLAHAVACGEGALEGINGAIEPLVGRETRQAGRHGKHPVLADVCWKPGASVQPDVKVRIATYGLWRADGGENE